MNCGILYVILHYLPCFYCSLTILKKITWHISDYIYIYLVKWANINRADNEITKVFVCLLYLLEYFMFVGHIHSIPGREYKVKSQTNTINYEALTNYHQRRTREMQLTN